MRWIFSQSMSDVADFSPSAGGGWPISESMTHRFPLLAGPVASPVTDVAAFGFEIAHILLLSALPKHRYHLLIHSLDPPPGRARDALVVWVRIDGRKRSWAHEVTPTTTHCPSPELPAPRRYMLDFPSNHICPHSFDPHYSTLFFVAISPSGHPITPQWSPLRPIHLIAQTSMLTSSTTLPQPTQHPQYSLSRRRVGHECASTARPMLKSPFLPSSLPAMTPSKGLIREKTPSTSTRPMPKSCSTPTMPALHMLKPHMLRVQKVMLLATPTRTAAMP